MQLGSYPQLLFEPTNVSPESVLCFKDSKHIKWKILESLKITSIAIAQIVLERSREFRKHRARSQTHGKFSLRHWRRNHGSSCTPLIRLKYKKRVLPITKAIGKSLAKTAIHYLKSFQQGPFWWKHNWSNRRYSLQVSWHRQDILLFGKGGFDNLGS